MTETSEHYNDHFISGVVGQGKCYFIKTAKDNTAKKKPFLFRQASWSTAYSFMQQSWQIHCMGYDVWLDLAQTVINEKLLFVFNSFATLKK